MKKKLFLLAFCILLFPVFGEKDPYYFIQLSDIHFGRQGNREMLETAVRRINRLNEPVRFVAVTGDIMNDNIRDQSADREFLSIMSQCRFKVYYIAGNHDILADGTSDTALIYQKHFGKLLDYHDDPGIRSVFIFTEPCLRDIQVPDFQPLNELEALLKKSRGRDILIFTHHSSVGDYLNGISYSSEWEKTQLERWQIILKKYQVKALITGHFHRDEHHWIADTPVYISPSVDGKWSMPSYRIYKYENKKISYRTIPIR